MAGVLLAQWTLYASQNGLGCYFARTKMKTLFFTGFLQVFLVTAQTWFIARSNFAAVAVFGFLISFAWSFNVKRIAIGTRADAAVYSLGASLGAVVGLAAGKILSGI